MEVTTSTMLSVRGGNHGRPPCGNPPEVAEKISAGGRYGWGRDNTHGFAIPSPMGSNSGTHLISPNSVMWDFAAIHMAQVERKFPVGINH